MKKLWETRKTFCPGALWGTYEHVRLLRDAWVMLELSTQGRPLGDFWAATTLRNPTALFLTSYRVVTKVLGKGCSL